MARTTEYDFETNVSAMLVQAGWSTGTVAEWDKERALFPARILAFVQATQPRLWAQMLKLHGADLSEKLLTALVKELNLKGSLHVLRHGFKFFGKLFRLAYFKPAHSLAPDVQKLYEGNTLTVTRQVPCHPDKNDTADMLSLEYGHYTLGDRLGDGNRLTLTVSFQF